VGGKGRHAIVRSVVDAMMYITLSINNCHLTDWLSASTSSSSSGELWIGVNRRRCDDNQPAVLRLTGGDVRDELCHRRLANGQTHRHSRHHHRGAGPTKSDEEGHLIYKDGDVLFERCTNQHHHFFVAVTLSTLATFSALCWDRNQWFYLYQSKDILVW